MFVGGGAIYLFLILRIENHDRTFRIRTSRNLNDLKAKLATPWANTEIKVGQREKFLICIGKNF